MNRQEYLAALEKALKGAGVRDSADILDEYSEHFDMKQADGYGEEEIAAKLALPESIAQQYKEIGKNDNDTKGISASRAITITGIIFSDVIALMFFIIMYAWVVVLGALTLSSIVAGFMTGIMTATRSGVAFGVTLIPYMPFLCALFLGITLLALAVLSAVGTEYCRLYVTQLLRVYIRWHKNVLSKGGHSSLPLSIHPKIAPKKRRIMRSISLLALVVFSVSFIVGLISMMIAAGSLEPWHVWQWFV